MMHQVYYTHLEEGYTETYTRFYSGGKREVQLIARTEDGTLQLCSGSPPLFFFS